MDLTIKHYDGYKLNLEDIEDGWMMGQNNELLFCVLVEHKKNLFLLS